MRNILIRIIYANEFYKELKITSTAKREIVSLSQQNVKSYNPKEQSREKKLFYPGTVMHLEFDHVVDRPEIINNLIVTYFKRKTSMKIVNVLQHPGDEHCSRKVSVWSGMVGGKATKKTAQCLQHAFNNLSI